MNGETFSEVAAYRISPEATPRSLGTHRPLAPVVLGVLFDPDEYNIDIMQLVETPTTDRGFGREQLQKMRDSYPELVLQLPLPIGVPYDPR